MLNEKDLETNKCLMGRAWGGLKEIWRRRTWPEGALMGSGCGFAPHILRLQYLESWEGPGQC